MDNLRLYDPLVPIVPRPTDVAPIIVHDLVVEHHVLYIQQRIPKVRS